MRILMVAESIARAGGAEEYLADVVAGLTGIGHEVSVFYKQPLDHQSSVLGGVAKVSTTIDGFEPAKFLESLSKLNPDVVNFQNVIDHRLLEVVARRVPTTVFLHNHESYCPGNSKYFFTSGRICTIPASLVCGLNAYKEGCMSRRPLRILENIQGRLATLKVLKSLKKIVCNSHYLKDNLISNGLDGGSIVVNHLFPRSHSGFGELPGNSADRAPVVLFVGRLFKEKGADHLLKALSMIKSDLRAVIAGEGWEKESLMGLAKRLKLSERVEFRGFCDRSEVDKLYAQARLLVVPSLWPEPFGLVGLEAFSFGKPVVAYGSGGIGEWLEDGQNGFLVERGNIKWLSQRVELLVADEALASRLGVSGRARVDYKFTLAGHLGKLVELYEEIK